MIEDPLIGSELGDYVVERAFASGGMGIVYRAQHRLLGRSVAVKVLKPQYAHDASQVQRFLKEARAISTIRHRGIVAVENFGHLPDGRQYMVMEFIEGETLEQALKREQHMDPERALPIIDEVLDALSAAHKVGVVHRDLKPSNIFLELQSNGSHCCKLVDFGLARHAALSATDVPAFAGASLVAGTPEYIAPEQAMGMAATPRTDLYSLGVMLYELLTGVLPYRGSVGELMHQHAYAKIPNVSWLAPVPRELDALVESLMVKNPDARPASAEVVRHEVSRILREMKEAPTRQVKILGLGAQPLPSTEVHPKLKPMGHVVASGHGAKATLQALHLDVPTEAHTLDGSADEHQVDTNPEPLVPLPDPAGPEPTRAAQVSPEAAKGRRAVVFATLGAVAVIGLYVALGPAPAAVQAAQPIVKITPPPDVPRLPPPPPPAQPPPVEPLAATAAVDPALEDMLSAERREENRRQEEKARVGVLNTPQDKIRHSANDCKPGWKQAARKHLAEVASKLRRAAASSPDKDQVLIAIETNHESFRAAIDQAQGLRECIFALDAIDIWAVSTR